MEAFSGGWLEQWAVLDPSYVPLITPFSLSGLVISHTTSSCGASLWPLVIYLEKQQTRMTCRLSVLLGLLVTSDIIYHCILLSLLRSNVSSSV